MKAASAKEIKDELKHLDRPELLEIVLRLSRFKKENKELLTYLLFSATNEAEYVAEVKKFIAAEFETINTSGYFYIRKSTRRILKNVKKFIRYSGKKETELELLLFFLQQMKEVKPSIHRNKVLQNLYDRQIALIEKNMLRLHEDLQYDFRKELEALTGN